MKSKNKSGIKMPQGKHLRSLGVYGYDAVEIVILSALVTEQPLLLVGKCGTGKTFLLNSISEALGLEHRHYNASTIAFDDLVGFPYPEDDRSGVRFLQTPATVWGAESVLIDEISRCKPEHQNRLFSLLHERRLQGIKVDSLRYRWAAMNPCTADQSPGASYVGSEPLDEALADRFALIVNVTDWGELDPDDKLAVAEPSGEGRISKDATGLVDSLADWQGTYRELLDDCPEGIKRYAVFACNHLEDCGIRLSPRRCRMLCMSLLAAFVVDGGSKESLTFRQVLRSSIPQPCFGKAVDDVHVAAAHRAAWNVVDGEEMSVWMEDILREPSLGLKIRTLLGGDFDPDVKAQAIIQVLGSESRERAAAFAFALYPAAASGKIEIGKEAVNDLGSFAQPILHVKGEVSWRQVPKQANGTHPNLYNYHKAIKRLWSGARKSRAEQFFTWAVFDGLSIADPDEIEQQLNDAVKEVAACVD